MKKHFTEGKDKSGSRYSITNVGVWLWIANCTGIGKKKKNSENYGTAVPETMLHTYEGNVEVSLVLNKEMIEG